MEDIRPCRVKGLTSEKGRRLNGLAASAPFLGFDDSSNNNNNNNDKRIAVDVEGQPNTMSLKYGNLEFFPPGSVFDGGMGVGRGTIRDAQFMATAIDNYGCSIVSKEPISGGAERSRGNLMAVEAHLKAHISRTGSGGCGGRGRNNGIILMCTDLNISIAINRIATTCTTTGHEEENALLLLSSSQQSTLQPIIQLIRQLVVDQGNIVFANFRPHRVQPDGYDPNDRRRLQKWGQDRVDAVKRGWYIIFPCTSERQRDALEVRYLLLDNNRGTSSFLARNESYLDYGPEEVEAYILNAVALGDTERLYPEILARVDPQAFWSCIQHIDKCCETLQSASLPNEHNTDLHNQWDEIRKGGIKKSRELWQEVAGASPCPGRLPETVIEENNNNYKSYTTESWGIDFDAKHDKVLEGCAHISLLMMLEASEREGEGGTTKPMNVHLLDDYCRLPTLQISRFASLLQTLYQKEQGHIARFGQQQQQLQANDRRKYLIEALQQEGYGSKDFNYISICGHCGNNSGSSSATDLAVCSKCHGAAYCNRECQKAAWKKHKKSCSPDLAQNRRAVQQLAARYELELS